MTFQSKPKICSFCGLPKRLWKAHPPTCQDCNGRNKQAALDEIKPWHSAAEEEFLDKFKKEARGYLNKMMTAKPTMFASKSALKAKPKPTINGRLLHTALYMSAFGYGDTDFIPSELSGERCQDVHHIAARGSGGTKTEDRIENLIGLTRSEHEEFGDKKHLMAFLYRKHLQFMLHCGVKFDRDWIEGEIERWTAEEINNDN